MNKGGGENPFRILHEPVSKRFSLVKIKSKIPDFEWGKAKILFTKHTEYIEYFED